MPAMSIRRWPMIAAMQLTVTSRKDGAGSMSGGEVARGEPHLEAEWWRTDEMLGISLRDLIARLDDVGELPIPYARLPRRLGSYSEEFPRWVDVAGQTPRELLERPKLGAAAVRALISAA